MGSHNLILKVGNVALGSFLYDVKGEVDAKKKQYKPGQIRASRLSYASCSPQFGAPAFFSYVLKAGARDLRYVSRYLDRLRLSGVESHE